MQLDPRRCAMIIQDLQNDVIMDGGAFADSGAPGHARAAARGRQCPPPRRGGAGARRRHHPCLVQSSRPGAPGVTLNAPLFEGLVDSGAMVRGSWGAAPVPGLEPRAGDFVVEKMRMSAWEGTQAGDHPQGDRPRHDHQHRRLDQHVGRAHRPHRRRQGLLHDRAGRLLLDHERATGTTPPSTLRCRTSPSSPTPMRSSGIGMNRARPCPNSFT